MRLWAKNSPWPDRAKTKADANRADLIGRAKEEKDKQKEKYWIV